MKKVKNKRTGANYELAEKKDFLKKRKVAERFHLQSTKLAKQVVKLLKKHDESKTRLFFHYVLNMLAIEDVPFYHQTIEMARLQHVINEIYLQIKHDFPSLSIPRDEAHLKMLK